MKGYDVPHRGRWHDDDGATGFDPSATLGSAAVKGSFGSSCDQSYANTAFRAARVNRRMPRGLPNVRGLKHAQAHLRSDTVNATQRGNPGLRRRQDGGPVRRRVMGNVQTELTD